jgi:predicted metal-dependent phosphoesterase TrpH
VLRLFVVQELIDLHSHSTASDGRLCPAELVRAAHDKGIAAFALTDHDTIDGLDEAEDEAQKTGVSLIRGVEIEINWNEFPLMDDDGLSASHREFHLLGLGLDKVTPEFLELLNEMRLSREQRNIEMVRRMGEMGLPNDLDEIYKISGTSFIGRPHFADYLVQKKAVRNYEQAFKKYFAKGSALFVPRRGADFKRSLRLIKESGGIAVIAHPTSLYVSWAHIEAIFVKLKAEGLDGMEAWHPMTTAHEAHRLSSIAKKLGLCTTAGSDYHGEGRRDRKLGLSAGGTKNTRALFDFSPVIPLLDTFDGNLRKLIASFV